MYNAHDLLEVMSVRGGLSPFPGLICDWSGNFRNLWLGQPCWSEIDVNHICESKEKRLLMQMILCTGFPPS